MDLIEEIIETNNDIDDMLGAHNAAVVACIELVEASFNSIQVGALAILEARAQLIHDLEALKRAA